jgi:SAM-dependent methyltransferase
MMTNGKGFRNVGQFLAQYQQSALVAANVHPDLEFSLHQLRGVPSVTQCLDSLGGSPTCLIEGYSSPRNGGAVLRFLHDHGVNTPVVEAFDLLDVQTVHPDAGWPQPAIAVHIADACNLADQFPTASQDMALQDYLLNCAPPVDHGQIMAEAARVLRPGGFLILSFTDWDCLAGRPTRTTANLEREFPLRWSDHAYNLHDLAGDEAPALLQQLTQSVVAHDSGEWLTWICADTGHFEFYFPRERVLELLEDAGFELVVLRTSQGTDSNGLDCVRHHCVCQRGGSIFTVD